MVICCRRDNGCPLATV